METESGSVTEYGGGKGKITTATSKEVTFEDTHVASGICKVGDAVIVAYDPSTKIAIRVVKTYKR